MRLLIVGAGGFIGLPLAQHLTSAGHEVIGLSRTAPTTFAGLLHHVRADREDAQAVVAAVKSRQIESIVDLLALTVATTRRLLDALEGHIARYVLISSGDVYRNYGGLLRKEATQPILDAMGEEAPLRTSRYPYRETKPRANNDPDRWLDDYDKIPIEADAVARHGIDWTILRLPMVFGPGDRQRRFGWLIRPLAAGAEHIAMPRQWAQWRTSYGHVEDVAAGIALAATHEAASRRVFNLGMRQAPTHEEWVSHFAAVIGWRGQIRFDSDPMSPQSTQIKALDLSFPLVLNTQRVRSELDFAEVVDEHTALARTIEHELSYCAWWRGP
jgi:nucleoside-diphosphate-sugar epimerase